MRNVTLSSRNTRLKERLQTTQEQNEDRQFLVMREYGVPEENVILDKQSGKDFERPSYRKLLEKLKAGDTLVIKSIDRLGRTMMRFWSSGGS